MNSSIRVEPKVGVLLKQRPSSATENQEQRLFALIPVGEEMIIAITDFALNSRTQIHLQENDFRQWAKAVLAMLDEKVDTHTVDSDKDTTHGNPGSGPFRPD